MKPPTELELSRLMHAYDPVKAHKYYEEHKKLKGRKPGRGEEPRAANRRGSSQDPRIGKTRDQIHMDARAKQRKELTASIHRLEGNLRKLEALIKEKMRKEDSEDRKGKAKKERAAKERTKPKTAAEKAAEARENKQYREKHKQELKSKRKRDGSSGGGSKKGAGNVSSKTSVTELKRLATRVRGQIAVAKTKLAAL